jgi:hypothetical protein
MMPSHSAPSGGKSSARDRTPQVVLRLSVAAGKLRTGELQNGFHLSSGYPLRQKTPGDPQIHNAPVRPMETLPNTPSLQTVLVDRDGFGGGDRGHEVAVGVGCIGRQPGWSPISNTTKSGCSWVMTAGSPQNVVCAILYVQCCCQSEMRRFEWDEEKNRANLAKHRIIFETAKLVFDDPLR